MDQKKKLANLPEKTRYETLLEVSGSGVYEINIHTKNGIFSDTFRQLLNIPESETELSVKDFLKCVTKPFREEVKIDIEKSLSGKPFLKNFQLKTKKNKLWVKGKGKIISSEDGEEMLYLVFTPLQYQPADVHMEGYQKLAEVLDLIPIPLLIIADDGSILHINKAITEITGYKHEEILTVNHWIKLAYGDDIENYNEIINQLFEVKKYRSDGEFQFVTKTKEIKYLHFYTAPLGKDKSGRKLILSMAADVTDIRIKDELILRQAEELQVLTNKLPHLLFTANKKGEIEYINENWFEFTGLNEKELKANENYLIHPNDLPKTRKYIEISIKESKNFNQDIRIKNKHGKFRWLNLRAVPVLDEKKNVLKWIGTGTDVHDKYIAEQRLLHKASEFISLVEMIDHHVWVINADGTPEYFNKAWYQYTGLTKEQTWNDRTQAIHPSQREKVKYHVEMAWKKKVSYEVSLKLRNHAGEYQWFLTKGQPIIDEQGELIKYVGTITNIHTHRELEEALKSEVSVLSEIIESIPQMAWTADPEGNTDFYNKRWYDYTGQSPKDAFGWGWKKSYHPEDIDKALEMLMPALQNGKGFENEARILKHKDNTYRWHLVKTTPVKDRSGSIKYWITTATDINEQKNLEHKKGQFLNIASHELRTPLTTLMGYLQLMEYAIEEQNYKDVATFLTKSSGSSQRMNRLINDLLNLSSIDTGKIGQFHTEKLHLAEFVKEIIENYMQLHPEKEFHLNIKSGDYIEGNSFRLEQVIDNLISNAIKYAPSSPIFVEVHEADNQVQVSVSDKGEGIPSDKLEAIFDRFYRVKDNGITSGLGVGLFISREIINEHGGRIWAESNGQGTSFKFSLPKATV